MRNMSFAALHDDGIVADISRKTFIDDLNEIGAIGALATFFCRSRMALPCTTSLSRRKTTGCRSPMYFQ